MKLFANVFVDLQVCVLPHVPFTADRVLTEGQRQLRIHVPKPPYASSSVEIAPSYIVLQLSFGC